MKVDTVRQRCIGGRKLGIVSLVKVKVKVKVNLRNEGRHTYIPRHYHVLEVYHSTLTRWVPTLQVRYDMLPSISYLVRLHIISKRFDSFV
jgi:hypothetical protein